MRYPYYCSHCDITFDVKKPMSECSRKEQCECGREAERRYTPIPFSFGWRLTDATRERFGPRDEFERDL